MFKSTVSNNAPIIPTRLIVFWAHRPYQKKRALDRLFQSYGITAENAAVEAEYQRLMDPAQTSLAGARLKVNHYAPQGSKTPRLSADKSSAASASPSSLSGSALTQEMLDPPDKITHIYAVKIPEKSGIKDADVHLNDVVIRTFEYITDYITNCNVQEIILINETNMFFSGEDIELLPEIKARFACMIKMSKDITVKEKLSILDLSNSEISLAENESLRLALHQNRKIPLIVGFQEGGGGNVSTPSDKLFQEFFGQARIHNQASMVKLNRLTLCLLSDKTLTRYATFSAQGTSLASIIRKLAVVSTPTTPVSTPMQAPRSTSSASASPVGSACSSAAASPKTSSTPSYAREGLCIARPYYPQWPLASLTAAAAAVPLKDSASVIYRHLSPSSLPQASPLNSMSDMAFMSPSSFLGSSSPAASSPARSLPSSSPGSRNPGLPTVPKIDKEHQGSQAAGDLLFLRNLSAANLRKTSADSLQHSLPNSPLFVAKKMEVPPTIVIQITPRDAVSSRVLAKEKSTARPDLRIRPPIISASAPTSPVSRQFITPPADNLSRSQPGTLEPRPQQMAKPANSPACAGELSDVRALMPSLFFPPAPVTRIIQRHCSEQSKDELLSVDASMAT